MALEGHELLERKAAQDAGRNARAICAASITTVPLPQQGSYSGWGLSPCGSQPEAAIMAAARVSLSGASPLSSRQPRLNSASPEVSM
jgi:hypothetical protein